MGKRMLLLEYDAGYVGTINNFENKFLVENKIDATEEISKNGVPTTIFAVLQKYDVLNENNRIYSQQLLKRESDRYLKDCIPQKNTVLEANHPESTLINILNSAGIITDIWWDGITLLGKIKLNTSKGFCDNGIVSTSGDHISNMLLNDIMVGVSSRGVGSLQKKGDVNHVQDDYQLICWDFVNKPSSKGSWTAENVKDLSPYIDKTVTEQHNKSIKTTLEERLFNYLDRYQ